MINRSFQICHGIGPAKEANLYHLGLQTWQALLDCPSDFLPFSPAKQISLRHELAACQAAFDRQDLDFLLKRLPTREHWRVLASFLPKASYFDIETSGLSPSDSVVTVVVCLHQGKYYEFVRGENLDEFLDLLDEVNLLVSFNGSSFDVPRIRDEYHIPELPCPHVDLRWISYHQGLRGGLKQIEEKLGFPRGDDLKGLAGDDAVWLWQKWRLGCRQSRDLLIRYCRRDVEALEKIAQFLLSDSQHCTQRHSDDA